MNDFKPRPVEWTREKSSRFWDKLSSIPGIEENYFSAAVADSLVRFARRSGAARSGRVLDFGCGPGHLLERLLKGGIGAEGADFSRSSVERLDERFAGHPRFGGAHLIESIPTHFEAGEFSTVFLVETIEHLLDDDLEATVAEIHRITAPGGFVVVTTPNDENLAAGQTVCPDCGCIFHRVQHVRSWTPKSLAAFVGGFGFETVEARALFLQNRWWKARLVTAAAPLFGKSLPHLVYVGRKR